MTKDAIQVRRAVAPLGAPYKDCLVAADDESAARIARVEFGEVAEIRIVRHRSLPQHRLFFGILQHVAENSRFETAERLLVALKIRLGRYDLCRLPNGRDVPVPQSISFDKMDQADFQGFFNDAVRLICEDVLDNYDQAKLIREVEEMLGIPPMDENAACHAGPPLALAAREGRAG